LPLLPVVAVAAAEAEAEAAEVVLQPLPNRINLAACVAGSALHHRIFI
jgi:hypothetical protein